LTASHSLTALLATLPTALTPAVLLAPGLLTSALLAPALLTSALLASRLLAIAWSPLPRLLRPLIFAHVAVRGVAGIAARHVFLLRAVRVNSLARA
jgi:hypothetical protein